MQLVLKSRDGELLQCAATGRITQKELGGDAADPLVDLAGPDVYSSRVLLDLASTDFLDSSGVSWLLRCHKRCLEQGGALILHSTPPIVLNVLKVLKMHLVFRMAPNADEAARLARGGAA